MHETAFKKDPGLPEVGVGWMLQVVPSHRSVSVCSTFAGEDQDPTAQACVGDDAATPYRLLCEVPTLADGTTCHTGPQARPNVAGAAAAGLVTHPTMARVPNRMAVPEGCFM